MKKYIVLFPLVFFWITVIGGASYLAVSDEYFHLEDTVVYNWLGEPIVRVGEIDDMVAEVDTVIDDEEEDPIPNSLVERVPKKEIAANITPRAVAYNYIMAILNEDYSKMFSYMSSWGREWTDYVMAEMYAEYGIRTYHELFSLQDSKYNVLGWKPYLKKGYEVAVLYVQDISMFDEEEVFVYVHCVPSDEINIYSVHGITVCNEAHPKIIVRKEDGVWKVDGIK